jgi:hypothetical protein
MNRVRKSQNSRKHIIIKTFLWISFKIRGLKMMNISQLDHYAIDYLFYENTNDNKKLISYL